MTHLSFWRIKGNLLLLFLCHLCVYSNGQEQVFKLRGTLSDSVSGKVFLVPAIADIAYYGDLMYRVDSSIVTEGHFTIDRRVNRDGYFPYFLQFTGSTNNITGMLFLSPRDEAVHISSVDPYIAPVIPRSSVQQDMQAYISYFSPLILKINELELYIDELVGRYRDSIPPEFIKVAEARSKKLQQGGDSLFGKFASSNRGSIVTLWKLIERFKNRGYETQYQDVLNLLEKPVQESEAGRILEGELTSASVTAIGHVFPDIEVKTSGLNSITLSPSKIKGNYIFIDYWFSSCAPCIAQFPEMRQIYEEYQHAGFQVVGISIDSGADYAKWLTKIDEEQLRWPNYLDEGGRIAEKWAINSFPSNFLLNQDGEIIERNITPGELSKILQDNLKIANNIEFRMTPP